jgi:hypothetical protein
VSLSADGNQIVWRDDDLQKLVFRELNDGKYNVCARYVTPESKWVHFQHCLLSDDTCVITYANDTEMGLSIFSYPEMTLQAEIAIPFDSPERVQYITGASLSPSGRRIAVASNDRIWVIDKVAGQWRKWCAWTSPMRAHRALAWSPDSTLLAQGHNRGHKMEVARIGNGKIELLPIFAQPNPTVAEVREHIGNGSIEQLNLGTLYEVDVSVWQVVSVGFFQHEGLLAACGHGPVSPDLGRSSVVAIWDTRAKQLKHCHRMPGSSLRMLQPCSQRRSYFVLDNNAIYEVSIDTGRITAIYQGEADNDRFAHPRHFVVSIRHLRLTAIDERGRVAIWELPSQNGK